MDDRPEIFVGIPCYNTGEKLLVTLQSLQQQRFKSFKAIIAVEPSKDSQRTLEIAHYIAKQDHRFQVKINNTRLGWAGNIQQLMKDVDCPYFTILPHDDLLHEDHLYALHKAITENPKVIVAFPNLYFFGACDGIQEGPSLQGSLAERLINHFTAGESSEFWRGLTRSNILDDKNIIPVCELNSFAAEYEWAVMLLANGPTLRVNEAFFYKRIHEANAENSVSSEWVHKYSEHKIFTSLTEHKKRMLKIIEGLPLDENERYSTLMAFEAAHIWKVIHFTMERFAFPPSELKQLEKLKKQLERQPPEPHFRGAIKQRLTLCDLFNQYLLNNVESMDSQLYPLIELDPKNLDAQVLLMKTYLRKNDLSKALTQLNVLTALFPNSWRIREVSNWYADSLKNRFLYE